MLSRVKGYLEDQLLGFALVLLLDVLLAKRKLVLEFSPLIYRCLQFSCWPEVCLVESFSSGKRLGSIDSDNALRNDTSVSTAESSPITIAVAT
ncbi:hypothetical protein C4D60_Mb06t26020 [Musa balbisiana]|uniref:Uncharacterized protein n=1 Tax=Musa balbisiana TaxID=52838 RepID=A0A4S8IQW1_MUSBA|nr:hypothetical protein C4D60_Mb06t26020 [Musa balbisiana]